MDVKTRANQIIKSLTISAPEIFIISVMDVPRQAAVSEGSLIWERSRLHSGLYIFFPLRVVVKGRRIEGGKRGGGGGRKESGRIKEREREWVKEEMKANKKEADR